jgi:hypothetical protein
VFCWGGLIALQRAVSVTRAENAPT